MSDRSNGGAPHPAAIHEVDGERISTEFGRIPSKVYLGLGARPDATTYRYRRIHLVPVLVAITLMPLWGYFGYSLIFGAGWSTLMALIGFAMLLVTGLAAIRLQVWSDFARLSGVVMTDRYLAWRSGRTAFLVPWTLIEPEALGLERLAFTAHDYERFVMIKVGESAEPIFIQRLYARLEDHEGFLRELIRRIPKERWAAARAAGHLGPTRDNGQE